MTQFNLKSIATIFAAVLLLGATGNARANLITFDFEATVQDFGFGALLTGSYTFDSNTPDMTPPNAVGIYPGAIVAMDITMGSLTASATALGRIIVNTASTQYQVTPKIPMSGNTVMDTTLISFEFTLVGVPLVSDALPTSPPNYSQSIATLGFIQQGRGEPSFGVIDSISTTTVSTTTVPEPATLLLLGLTLLAVAPKVRRRP